MIAHDAYFRKEERKTFYAFSSGIFHRKNFIEKFSKLIRRKVKELFMINLIKSDPNQPGGVI